MKADYRRLGMSVGRWNPVNQRRIGEAWLEALELHRSRGVECELSVLGVDDLGSHDSSELFKRAQLDTPRWRT